MKRKWESPARKFLREIDGGDLSIMNAWRYCPLPRSTAADRERWHALRVRAVRLAYAAVKPQGITISMVRNINDLMMVAHRAFCVRMEGLQVDRQRAALVLSRQNKSAELRKARKAYKDALGRIRPEKVGDKEIRFPRASRVAMAEASALMSEHPELALDFPSGPNPLPGVPFGPIIRRDSRTPQKPGESGPGFQADPLGHLKATANLAMRRMGLGGRVNADVRAVVLFALGLTSGFDPKALLRLDKRDARPAKPGARVPRLIIGRAITAHGLKRDIRASAIDAAERFLIVFGGH